MTKLEAQLFQALQGMVNMYVSGVQSGDWGSWDPEDEPEVKAAREAMHEIDMELGPLPHWAVSHNLTREPVKYAQLCTRDGQRTGNAMLVDINLDDLSPYTVLTDMGQQFKLSEVELVSMFSIGPYVMDVRGEVLRRRQNPEQHGDKL